MSHQSEQFTGFEIAVTGMACRFPGAKDTEQFWANLVAGRETVSFFSEEELLASGIGKDVISKESYVKAKGIIDGADHFDAGFFGLTAKEAALMDPQARVLCEVAYTALENAACNPDTEKGLIGVYMGASPNVTWQQDSFCSCSDVFSEEFATLLLNDKDFLSTKLSYLLNLKGPSMSVYTACSTSLVAVDLACQSLITGKCDTALAGAVSISLPVKAGYHYEQGMIMSKDGHTKSFDGNTTGSVFSDGAGVVVLKRLSDALENGDLIHAVIRGMGINNDGSSKVGYTAPSVQGQAAAVRAAYDMAEISPDSIGYIETHGSGTYIGDRIEIDALYDVFKNAHPDFRCPIGSVKSNFGHLNTAAGMAGLIKTILILKHKKIPASLHCSRPIDKLAGDQSLFYVNKQLSAWNGNYPRRAGVSSFGIGGTNVHAVLQEAPAVSSSAVDGEPRLLLLSAKSIPSLDGITADIKEMLEKEPAVSLADVSHTLQLGRQHHAERRFIVAAEPAKAAALLATPDARQVYSGTADAVHQSVVMLFPGVGSSYSKMAAALYHQYPYFKNQVDHCFHLLEQQGYTGSDAVFRNSNLQHKAESHTFTNSQLDLFIFEYALSGWLIAGGLTPSAFLGYSLGEYTAACLAGVFSLEDTLKILLTRGRLVESLPRGAMLSIPLTAEETQPMLPDGLHIAIDNKYSCVVAGPHDEIEKFAAFCRNKRLFTFLVSSIHALHCPLPDRVVEEFRACLRQVDFAVPSIPFLSNVTGKWADENEITDPEYWVKQMTQTVLFSRNIDTLIRDMQDTTLLEAGPGNDLSLLLRRSVPAEQHHVVLNIANNDDSPVPQQEYFLHRLGLLWLQGQPLNWEYFQPVTGGRRIALPAYSFEKQFFSVQLNAEPAKKTRPATADGRKQAIKDWFYLPVWKQEYTAGMAAAKDQRRCLVLSNPGNELELPLITAINKDDLVVVQTGMAYKKEGERRYTIDLLEKDHYKQLFHDTGIHDGGCRIIDIRNFSSAVTGFDDIDTIHDHILGELNGFTALMQALDESKLAANTEIDLAGNGYFNVAGDESIHVYKTPALGFLKVVPQEFPGIRCRVIDTGFNAPLAAKQVAAELATSPDGRAVAFRGKNRWVQEFRPAPLPETDGPIASLKENGNYLITGGSGTIGRAIARFLHEECRANVIICGRSAMPDREEWDTILEQGEMHPDYERVNDFASLEKAGARLFFFRADVANRQDMENGIAAIEAELGTINGIFHAAGIIDRHSFPPILTVESRDFEVQLQAKVKGTLVVKQVFENRSPDFVVLTSSLSPILGGLGLASYAAANQFLDACAQQPGASGTQWISLNWADWTGWEHKVAGFLISREAIAINISAAEGIETLRRILHYHYEYPQTIVSSADLKWRLDKWVRLQPSTDALQAEVSSADTSLRATRKRPVIQTAFTAPATGLEKQIAGIWENILGYEKIGAEDDFMELGGDSLKAITMLTRIRQLVDITVPLNQFFKTRTIRAIASLIENASPSALAPIPKAPVKELYPLASTQRRLFFLREFDPTGVGYNETHVELLEGTIDLEKLEAAFAAVIGRHDILRAGIQMTENGACQRVHPQVDFRIQRLGSARESDLTRIIEDFIAPFDFQSPPFLRVGVVNLEENRIALILDRHHIISDVVSTEILIRETIGFYLGLELPALSCQYTDYVEWQLSEKTTDNMQQMAAWWKDQFSDGIPVLILPADFNRPRVQDFAGSACHYRLNKELTAMLRLLAIQLDVTVHNLLVGLINVWLAKLTGQEDIVIGSPVVGRNHPDLEGLIGIFINTLPLRNQPSGDKSFAAFVKEISHHTIEALQHQEYQYEDLVEDLKIPRDFSSNPLFDVMFVYHNQAIAGLLIPGVKRTPYRFATKKSKVDINIVCWENEEHLDLEFEYSVALFRPETIRNWIGYFETIATTVLAQPELSIREVSLLTAEQEIQLLEKFRGAEVSEHLPLVLQQLFEAQVIKTPEKIAVVGPVKQYTYEALNREANQLARLLRGRGVDKGRFTGLFTSRNTSTVLGMLAIIKAGGAYLPVEPNLPASRCRYMLEDSHISMLLVDNESSEQAVFAADIPGIELLNIDDAAIFSGNADNLPLINKPGDPVYTIYTSGSTGTPKGIVLKHLNAVNLVEHCIHHTRLECSRVLQFSTISFDVSFSEIFYTLCSGGTLFLISGQDRKDLGALMNHIEKHAISTVFLPMSLLRILFSSEANAALLPGCIRHIQTAGEQVVINDIFRNYLASRGVWLHNHYGPSETHVVTTLEIDPAGAIPALPSIGYPVINTDIYLLNRYNQLLPPGIPGELCAGGAQVGLGYTGREELTQKSFPSDPFRPGETMYRTGDIARRNEDGTIDFLGRRDSQVKIRGYRVEPGEIENAMVKLAGIEQAVIKLITDTDGEKSLCSYIVTSVPVTEQQIRQQLAGLLPDFMIPAWFVFIDRLPVTNSGKIDYAALPAPEAIQKETIEAPATEAEATMRQLWAAILKTEPETLGVHDNFFERGGHSLKAMQLLYQVEQRFGVKLMLPDFFRNSTIRKTTQLLEAGHGNVITVIRQAEENDEAPATFFQQRLYYFNVLDPFSILYNMPMAFIVEGQPDIARIGQVIKQIITRHAELRTSFGVYNNQVVQRINDADQWQPEMLEPVSASAVLDAVQPFVRPFDLQSAPLIRAGIAPLLHSEGIVLLLDFHHSIFDGQSFYYFADEFARLYRGEELPPVRLQYKDYAHWEQTVYPREHLLQHQQYWWKRLSGADMDGYSLPYDFGRPAVRNYTGNSVHAIVDEGVYAAMQEFVQVKGYTVYAFLLTVFNVLLSRATGSETMIIGMPVAGRRLRGMEQVWGPFVNMLPVVNTVDPDSSFTGLLDAVQQNLLEDFAHQEFPMDKMVQLLKINPVAGRNPLFDAVLELDYTDESVFTVPGTETRACTIPRIIAKFDLTLYCRDVAGRLHLEMNYATELFEQDTIQVFMHYCLGIIEQVINDPGVILEEISLLKPEAVS